MVQRLSVVPYGRMQFVEITTGPVERLFGLATVKLHTAAAASDARIPGLIPTRRPGCATAWPPWARPKPRVCERRRRRRRPMAAAAPVVPRGTRPDGVWCPWWCWGRCPRSACDAGPGHGVGHPGLGLDRARRLERRGRCHPLVGDPVVVRRRHAADRDGARPPRLPAAARGPDPGRGPRGPVPGPAPGSGRAPHPGGRGALGAPSVVPARTGGCGSAGPAPGHPSRARPVGPRTRRSARGGGPPGPAARVGTPVGEHGGSGVLRGPARGALEGLDRGRHGGGGVTAHLPRSGSAKGSGDGSTSSTASPWPWPPTASGCAEACSAPWRRPSPSAVSRRCGRSSRCWWRMFGWCRLEVDLAGVPGHGASGGGTGRVTKALLPVGSRRRRAVPAPRSHRPRRAVALPRASRPARLKAPLSFHFLAAGHDEAFAVAVTGRVQRVTCWVPLEKAQSIRRVQGPVQRALGLATVHVDVPGRRVGAKFGDRSVGRGRPPGRGARNAQSRRPPAVVTVGGGPPGSSRPGRRWFRPGIRRWGRAVRRSVRRIRRYWNGTAWTPSVADDGVTGIDPL